MSRRPICVDCQMEMVPLKNHFVVEMMAGAAPYQKVAADKFGCPNCSFEVVVGFADRPLSEYWKADYDSHPADLQAWSSAGDKPAIR